MDMPRDVIIFAAGAVLTALAVKYADEPWLWDGTIYIGSLIMACAALDFLWKKGGRNFVISGLLGIGVLGCAGWYFWPQLKTAAQSAPARIIKNPCGSISADAPAWLKIAAGECGQTEALYPKENPRINEYYASLHDGKHYRQGSEDLTQDWASPFVEWSLEQADKIGPRQISPLAWLSWGHQIEKPQIGCVVILRIAGTRSKIGGPLAGGIPHVGFYFGAAPGDRIYVLGGNQDDKVKISDYSRSDVIGYRMPSLKAGLVSPKPFIPSVPENMHKQHGPIITGNSFSHGGTAISIPKGTPAVINENAFDHNKKDIEVRDAPKK